ncbi:actin family [Mycena sp. CBHHK59/15]|nr:actin family [Mycena sp. CBHHK59/15]
MFVVLDNGASTIKAGRLDAPQPRLVPNAVLRADKATYIGHEIDRCRDTSGAHYRLPFEKGYLTDWDAQKAIWDGIFSEDVLGITPSESTILVTEPYFNLPNIQDVYDQLSSRSTNSRPATAATVRTTPAVSCRRLLIATFMFVILSRGAAPARRAVRRARAPAAQCMVVVDAGFSFTHVVPLMDGAVVWDAVKRLDVGGKLLTNQLKEVVSLRQWNMMGETCIMNHVKESCCYVSTDFRNELEMCRRSNPKNNPVVQEYVLPDLSKNRRGRVRRRSEEIAPADQILYMGNERFTVPEALFRPGDIGLAQAGLAETLAAAIALLPADLQGMFYANIGLVGGTTKLPGFRARLLAELQPFVPVDCDAVIYESTDAVTEAYRAAAAFAARPGFASCAVTRAEYAENGSRATRRKFPGPPSASGDVGRGKSRLR